MKDAIGEKKSGQGGFRPASRTLAAVLVAAKTIADFIIMIKVNFQQ